MYITKTNIQTLVEEVMKELHAAEPRHKRLKLRKNPDRDRPRPAPKEKSRPSGYVGRGDTNTGGPKLDDPYDEYRYDGPDAPTKGRTKGRGGVRPMFAGYEEGIEESETSENNTLTSSDIEDFNLLARDSLAVIEDAGLIDQMRDMLPIQMRSVVDQKVSEFKSDLIEFIETKMIDLALTREQEL